MLNAYRGLAGDRAAVAPEFWYYYPAKVLGVDMIAFQREVPFHLALKTTFERFGCEGWGVTFCGARPDDVESESRERWIDKDTLETRHLTRTPLGTLEQAGRVSRDEPGWVVERPIKDFERDLPIYEHVTLDADPAALDFSGMCRAWEEVGESYLLEAGVCATFFDYVGGAREGGLVQAVYDFTEHADRLEALQERYIDFVRRKTRALCRQTPFESLMIGCGWSCNSLISPAMWRRWDKPVIRAVCEEAHCHGRLLHIHFHGKCIDCVGDFAELGIDCVCPFERPPGGDVEGRAGLSRVESALRGRTAMNGNVHTVETLIRGTPEDARREVREILEVFRDNPRVIVGTGDQVGRETPEENLHAMIDEARRGR